VDFASLRLWNLDRDPPKFERNTRTGPGGSFEFRSLPPGMFLAYAEGRAMGRRAATVRRVELRVGAKENITLTLRPGVEVGVTVSDRGGRPVAGSKVTIERTDRIPIVMNLSSIMDLTAFSRASRRAVERQTHRDRQNYLKECGRRRTVTDEKGRLAGIHLVPGDYHIQAAVPGYRTGRRTVHIGQGSKQAVEIRLEKE